jgi:hypothetical protein
LLSSFVRSSDNIMESLRFLLRLSAVVDEFFLDQFALETDGTFGLEKSTLVCCNFSTLSIRNRFVCSTSFMVDIRVENLFRADYCTTKGCYVMDCPDYGC